MSSIQTVIQSAILGIQPIDKDMGTSQAEIDLNSSLQVAILLESAAAVGSSPSKVPPGKAVLPLKSCLKKYYIPNSYTKDEQIKNAFNHWRCTKLVISNIFSRANKSASKSNATAEDRLKYQAWGSVLSDVDALDNKLRNVMKAYNLHDKTPKDLAKISPLFDDIFGAEARKKKPLIADDLELFALDKANILKVLKIAYPNRFI